MARKLPSGNPFWLEIQQAIEKVSSCAHGQFSPSGIWRWRV